MSGSTDEMNAVAAFLRHATLAERRAALLRKAVTQSGSASSIDASLSMLTIEFEQVRRQREVIDKEFSQDSSKTRELLRSIELSLEFSKKDLERMAGVLKPLLQPGGPIQVDMETEGPAEVIPSAEPTPSPPSAPAKPSPLPTFAVSGYAGQPSTDRMPALRAWPGQGLIANAFRDKMQRLKADLTSQGEAMYQSMEAAFARGGNRAARSEQEVALHHAELLTNEVLRLRLQITSAQVDDQTRDKLMQELDQLEKDWGIRVKSLATMSFKDAPLQSDPMTRLWAIREQDRVDWHNWQVEMFERQQRELISISERTSADADRLRERQGRRFG